MAAASVTRTSSSARLRSGRSPPTRSDPGTLESDMTAIVATSATCRNHGRVGHVTTSTSTRGGGRAQATRATLLAAARVVFAESGFAEANIADVVARAGASVGSLYHHFGGKADLYLALFEDYQARQEARAAAAVRAARTQGTTGPTELFLAGAAAYLRGCWGGRGPGPRAPSPPAA